MNVLVTGAAGYVGSICSERLAQRGHTVIALDNLSEGHRQAVPRAAAFWECDLGDPQELERRFRSTRIDAVMHFAAASVVEDSIKQPSTYYQTNVSHGLNLLAVMSSHNVNKLVFSSTAAVYGEPENIPISEEQETRPMNPYGRSKLLFEKLLEDYRTSRGLLYATLRYFNAGGATKERGENHRNETHIIPRLLQAALGQLDHFEVHGNDYPTPDGTCVRDYVHVLDIAEAHVLSLESLDRVSGHAFNVGTNRGYSVLEVVEATQRITRKAIRTTFGPRRPGDPAVLVASSEKIRRQLGWKPTLPDLDSMIETAWIWKQKFPLGYAGKAK